MAKGFNMDYWKMVKNWKASIHKFISAKEAGQQMLLFLQRKGHSQHHLHQPNDDWPEPWFLKRLFQRSDRLRYLRTYVRIKRSGARFLIAINASQTTKGNARENQQEKSLKRVKRYHIVLKVIWKGDSCQTLRNYLMFRRFFFISSLRKI